MMQEFVQQISDTVKRGISGIHTAMPGKVLAFDPAKCIATVQPAMKFKKPDGKTMDFPQITGVPVVFPQGAGQNTAVAFPVKAGDGCLIVVAEQSLDYWQYGQETNTDLAFDMTNAICIPGLFTKGNDAVQTACAENAVVLKAGGTVLKVAPDGVTITGKLTVSGEVVGSGVALSTHTHTGDSGGTTSAPA